MILSRNVLDYNYSGLGPYVKLAEKHFVNTQDALLFVPFQPMCLKWGFHFSRGPSAFRSVWLEWAVGQTKVSIT